MRLCRRHRVIRHDTPETTIEATPTPLGQTPVTVRIPAVLLLIPVSTAIWLVGGHDSPAARIFRCTTFFFISYALAPLRPTVCVRQRTRHLL